MSDGALEVPQVAVDAILSEVRRYGSGDLETGGFFLVEAGARDTVTAIAMAGQEGIERSWGSFRISATAIDVLFGWADERGLRIPAQFHSHGRGSRLSPIDRREGFNVPRFVSCVVPRYDNPPCEVARWGWWLFSGRAWVATEPASVITGEVETVTFDENGVAGA